MNAHYDIHAKAPHLRDDGGQAGLVEALVVCVRLLVSLPVLQLHLQGFVHPL